jgi:hypothetical protein
MIEGRDNDDEKVGNNGIYLGDESADPLYAEICEQICQEAPLHLLAIFAEDGVYRKARPHLESNLHTNRNVSISASCKSRVVIFHALHTLWC